MSVTNIYFARHGETEYNRCDQIQGRSIDAPLNDTGHLQAKAIAHHLKDVVFGRIISSSLQRSRQTAEAIAQVQNLDVVSYPELDEMDFGVLEGRPISEVKDELQKLHQTWKAGDVNYASRQGESPYAVFERADSRAKMIIEQNNHKNLLFVLHGRLLRILLSSWLGHGLSNMHDIPHANGALYQLQWNGLGFEKGYINKTDHLSIVNIEEVTTE